jgi:hypothetical protein
VPCGAKETTLSNAAVVKETLDLVKGALQAGATDPVAKAITQATGLVAYNLEAPSKKLFPVLTPLRNKIPRKGGGDGTAVNWKAVTKINSGNTSRASPKATAAR